MSSPIQTGNKRDRRMKPRFEISVRAKIQIQLIGSSSPIEFITNNISENGLLLDYNGKDRLTFNQFSILETWLYTPDKQPISFLTKFVRYQSTTRIAIRIIDIDSESQKRYLEFITNQASKEVE